MSDINLKYGTPTAISAINLASLADGSSWQLAKVNNTSTPDGRPYADAFVRVAIKLATGTPKAGAEVQLALAVSDDGTTWLGKEANGSDGTITPGNPTNLIFIPSELGGVIYTPSSGALTWKGFIRSISAVCGGLMPPYWQLIVMNKTGVAFDASGSNFSVQYTGAYAQVN
jgi:hypothetical protein